MSVSAGCLHRCCLWQTFSNHSLRRRGLRLRPLPSSRTRFSATKAYSGKEKDRLLKGVTVENREDVARILEQGQRAESTWTAILTDFYTPPVVAEALQALKLVPDIRPEAWGGYGMAERTRIRLSRADMLEDTSPLV